MSWSRNKFDQCAYQKDLSQSTSPINYSLDPNKFYNCSDCRIEFGIIGGNDVSITQGNMVDLESDLKNITRQYSKCPERQYVPYCEACEDNGGLPCGSHACKRQEKLRHLPSCNIIQQPIKVDHVGYDLKYPGCPVNNVRSIDGQEMKHPPHMNPVQWNGPNEQPDFLDKLNPANWERVNVQRSEQQQPGLLSQLNPANWGTDHIAQYPEQPGILDKLNPTNWGTQTTTRYPNHTAQYSEQLGLLDKLNPANWSNQTTRYPDQNAQYSEQPGLLDKLNPANWGTQTTTRYSDQQPGLLSKLNPVNWLSGDEPRAQQTNIGYSTQPNSNVHPSQTIQMSQPGHIQRQNQPVYAAPNVSQNKINETNQQPGLLTRLTQPLLGPPQQRSATDYQYRQTTDPNQQYGYPPLATRTF